MISKAEIALVRSLGQKKFRESTGLFVVEGEKMVEEALHSDFEVVSVFKTEDIGEANMEKISHLSSPSPALALLRKPQTDPFEIDSFIPEGLYLALDSVKDPGNLGTILRLSDWFGIKRLFLSEDCTEIFNPKVVQASMGAIFRMQVTYIDIKTLIPTFLHHQIPIYGTTLDGENIYQSDLNTKNALLIMGSENNGISADLLKLTTSNLFIPSYAERAKSSESLNVAIATAIICSEFRRNCR